MSTEAALQRKIVDYAKYHGFLAFKFASPAHRGVPDLILITPAGRTVYAEIKNPSGAGRLSTLQKITIHKMTEQGAQVYVLDDFEEARSVIRFEADADTDRSHRPDVRT